MYVLTLSLHVLTGCGARCVDAGVEARHHPAAVSAHQLAAQDAHTDVWALRVPHTVGVSLGPSLVLALLVWPVGASGCQLCRLR